jgi:hypothetical protein
MWHDAVSLLDRRRSWQAPWPVQEFKFSRNKLPICCCRPAVHTCRRGQERSAGPAGGLPAPGGPRWCLRRAWLPWHALAQCTLRLPPAARRRDAPDVRHPRRRSLWQLRSVTRRCQGCRRPRASTSGQQPTRSSSRTRLERFRWVAERLTAWRLPPTPKQLLRATPPHCMHAGLQ